MFNAAPFFIYIVITAYTPGPNNILSMSNAARYGLRKAFPFNLGIFSGLLIVMLLCALFSAALYTLAPKIALPLKLIGAVYMLYLAYKIYHNAAHIADEERRASFVSGILLQFVNAKIIIYGVTAMSLYVAPYFSSPLVLAAFALGLALICFSANMSWAMFGALFYKLFTKRQKLINTIMALLLVYCAVSLFL